MYMSHKRMTLCKNAICQNVENAIRSRRDLGMTAAIPQVPVPTAIVHFNLLGQPYHCDEGEHYRNYCLLVHNGLFY